MESWQTSQQMDENIIKFSLKFRSFQMIGQSSSNWMCWFKKPQESSNDRSDDRFIDWQSKSTSAEVQKSIVWVWKYPKTIQLISNHSVTDRVQFSTKLAIVKRQKRCFCAKQLYLLERLWWPINREFGKDFWEPLLCSKCVCKLPLLEKADCKDSCLRKEEARKRSGVHMCEFSKVFETCGVRNLSTQCL